jgi:hypothetical protein
MRRSFASNRCATSCVGERWGVSTPTPRAATRKVDVSADKRLKDRVADNLGKYEITESESLLFGESFGVTPDLKESPDGTLYVVSSTQCTIYEIRRK